MSDEAPDEDLDLAEWPDALDAYRQAHELGRRAAAEGRERKPGDADPARELATVRRRLGLRGLDPAAEARVRWAIDRGEAASASLVKSRGPAGRQAPREGSGLGPERSTR